MKPLLFCIAVLAMMSCSGSIPEPTPAQAEWANHQWQNTTVDVLRNGRSAYITKCSGCHSLYLPKEYSAQRWREIIEAMRTKAKLNGEEELLITKYLLAVRLDIISSNTEMKK